MAERKHTCANCAAFEVADGTCRLLPPTVIPARFASDSQYARDYSAAISRWPNVKPEHWCLAWQREVSDE